MLKILWGFLCGFVLDFFPNICKRTVLYVFLAVEVLWRCVCFHHWFRFPVSSCCLLSRHQSRPLPRPRGCSFPSISPPPSPHLLWSWPCCGPQRVCPCWVCALSSCLIKWCFSPIAVSWIGVSLCSYRRRQWQPTPVLLPGKSHGRRNLVGCSPWGHTELDMTEAT